MANTVELLSIANIESRKTELIPDRLFESIFMELTNASDDYTFKMEHTGNTTITIEKELFYHSTKNLFDCIYSFTSNPKRSIELYSNATDELLKMTIVSNIRLTRDTYDTLLRILNGTAKIYSKMGMKLHLSKIYLKRLEGEILFTPGKNKTTIHVMVPLKSRTEPEK